MTTLNTCVEKTLCVETSKIIILDGTLIYSRLELVELIDIKIFIDSPDAKRLKFRQRRDVLERGRTVDSINEQYSKTVRPMYDKFVYPSKKYANIIINNPKTLDKSVHIIKKGNRENFSLNLNHESNYWNFRYWNFVRHCLFTF